MPPIADLAAADSLAQARPGNGWLERLTNRRRAFDANGPRSLRASDDPLAYYVAWTPASATRGEADESEAALP